MKWIIASATALLLINPAHAMHKKGEPDPAPEKTYPAPKSKTDHAQAYDADLFKKDIQGFSGHLEVLLWTVAEGTLDYALKMNHSAWGPSTAYATGNYETATFDVDPGFRVGLTYFRAPHFWESNWSYTRMTSTGKNVSNKPGSATEYLVGTFPQILNAPLSSAKSSIHLNYNVFDWTVDRVFFPNPHLRLRVMGGATTAWMEQDWIVRYTDANPFTTTMTSEWQFVGAGLKTGSMVDWYWTGDLYMTGVFTFGTLIGAYSNHSELTTNYQPTGSDNSTVPVGDSMYKDARAVFTAQFLLGPSWQKNYEKTRIEIFTGFEANLWWNLQEVYRSSGNTNPFGTQQTFMNSGLLALYGFTGRVTFGF